MPARAELMQQKSSEESVASLIRFRKTWHDERTERNNHFHSPSGATPELVMTPALSVLFGMPELWITVDGIRYVPDKVVHSLLYRKDGVPISRDKATQKSFTVSIAMRKQSLEKRYGVRPLSAWEKQRHQYWDEPYVRSFYASLQADSRNRKGLINKVLYKIRDTVDAGELRILAEIVKQKTEETMQYSTKPVYEYLRRADQSR